MTKQPLNPGTTGESSLVQIDSATEELMNILAAIKREERKLEKELGRLSHKLDGVRAAGAAMSRSAGREIATIKKRVLSEAGRARISKAAKKRWAKIRAGAKKAAS